VPVVIRSNWNWRSTAGDRSRRKIISVPNIIIAGGGICIYLAVLKLELSMEEDSGFPGGGAK